MACSFAYPGFYGATAFIFSGYPVRQLGMMAPTSFGPDAPESFLL
jgi:hypothetical protein